MEGIARLFFTLAELSSQIMQGVCWSASEHTAAAACTGQCRARRGGTAGLPSPCHSRQRHAATRPDPCVPACRRGGGGWRPCFSTSLIRWLWATPRRRRGTASRPSRAPLTSSTDLPVAWRHGGCSIGPNGVAAWRSGGWVGCGCSGRSGAHAVERWSGAAGVNCSLKRLDSGLPGRRQPYRVRLLYVLLACSCCNEFPGWGAGKHRGWGVRAPQPCGLASTS